MSRVAAYRAKRRAELLEAVRACETILKGAKLSAEYKRCFAAMLKAGERYDKVRNIDSDVAFEDLSLWGAEPDDVSSSVDDALTSALETLQGVRDGFK